MTVLLIASTQLREKCQERLTAVFIFSCPLLIAETAFENMNAQLFFQSSWAFFNIGTFVCVYFKPSAGEIQMTQLYPSHIPTTWLQKGMLAIGSAAVAISNPKRGGNSRFLSDSTYKWMYFIFKKRLKMLNLFRLTRTTILVFFDETYCSELIICVKTTICVCCFTDYLNTALLLIIVAVCSQTWIYVTRSGLLLFSITIIALNCLKCYDKLSSSFLKVIVKRTLN